MHSGHHHHNIPRTPQQKPNGPPPHHYGSGKYTAPFCILLIVLTILGACQGNHP